MPDWREGVEVTSNLNQLGGGSSATGYRRQKTASETNCLFFVAKGRCLFGSACRLSHDAIAGQSVEEGQVSFQSLIARNSIERLVHIPRMIPLA